MADKERSGDETASAPGPKVERIFVKSKLPVHTDGGSKVAFHEKHSDHPGGEAFVYGEKPFEVALTAAVAVALRSEQIVRVTEEEVSDYADAEARRRAAAKRQQPK